MRSTKYEITWAFLGGGTEQEKRRVVLVDKFLDLSFIVE